MEKEQIFEILDVIIYMAQTTKERIEKGQDFPLANEISLESAYREMSFAALHEND